MTVDLLSKRTARFDGWRAKKEHEIKCVKERAQKKTASLEKAHDAEQRRMESKLFHQQRSASKNAVLLEQQVESTKKEAEKKIGTLQEEHAAELEQQKHAFKLELNYQEKQHSTKVKHVLSDVYKERRAMMKTMSEAEHERDAAIDEKDAAIAEKDAALDEKYIAVKTAVKEAKQEERQYYSKIIEEE